MSCKFGYKFIIPEKLIYSSFRNCKAKEQCYLIKGFPKYLILSLYYIHYTIRNKTNMHFPDMSIIYQINYVSIK